MPYRFLEGLTMADVAFEARGQTREEVFAAAGLAVTATQIKDTDSLKASDSRRFELSSESLEMLLFNFLQETIYYKDVDQLLFNRFELRISTDPDGTVRLNGTGTGEPIDPERHAQLVDVKAVTLHRFELVEEAGGWKATVILDV